MCIANLTRNLAESKFEAKYNPMLSLLACYAVESKLKCECRSDPMLLLLVLCDPTLLLLVEFCKLVQAATSQTSVMSMNVPDSVVKINNNAVGTIELEGNCETSKILNPNDGSSTNTQLIVS